MDWRKCGPPLPGRHLTSSILISHSQEPKIVLYDPEKLGLGKSGKAEGFPFR